jgi:putative PIN family toxin of toxin-antitoxin system
MQSESSSKPLVVPRLIIDINVLLNGIGGNDNSINRRLYDAFLRAEIRLVFSEEWLLEFERVLAYPAMTRLGIGSSTVARTMRELFLLGEFIAPVPQLDWDSLRDKKDWYLLDLLFFTTPNALITQDKKVLTAGIALGLPVVHPRDLVQLGFLP